MHRHLRAAVAGAICGAVGLGSAWAAVGVVPVPSPSNAATAASDPLDDAGTAVLDDVAAVTAPGERLPAGAFLAGAARRSIAPDPSKWLPNTDGVCGDDLTTYSQEAFRTADGERECLATFDHRWATEVNPRGIWARAAAIGNGESTVVMATLDAVGWFAAYPADVCADCGAAAIAETVEARTNGAVDADAITITSSHTHASPDTLSQTPTWYFEQVRDALIDAIVEAATTMEPVVLETGGAPAKAFNVDRRIVTRAVPDAEVGWLRAFNDEGTVATVVNFAVHPTVEANNAALHSGLVGPLTDAVEAELGGTALWMPGGLGDQTVNRAFGTVGIGGGIASVVLGDIAHDNGTRIEDNTIDFVRKRVLVPGENAFMLGASAAKVFVRDLLPPWVEPGGPVVVGKSGIPKPSCVTVATLNVVTSVTGIRIGRPGTGELYDPGDSVTIITAPGEIFASIGLITKDYLSKTSNVLVFGQTNDTLGYLIPREQYDATGAHGVGLLHNATDTGNYEESLNLGPCAGDTVQNAMLELGHELGVMGSGEGR